MNDARVGVVKRNTALLGVFTVLAALVHVGKEVLFAQRFGTTEAMDAFSVVFVLPNLLATFLVGGLAGALVPRAAATTPDAVPTRALWRFYVAVGGRLLAGILVVTVVLWAAGPAVVRALGIGFTDATAELALRLHRILVWSLPVSLSVGLGIALCQGLSRFVAPGLAAVLGPAVLVGVLLRGGSIETAAWGFVAGQTAALVLIAAYSAGALRPRKPGPADPPPTHEALAALGLVAVGWIAGILNVNIDLTMVTTLPDADGLAAVLRYAWKVVMLPISFFLSTVAVALLPAFSRAVEAGDTTATRRGVTYAIRVAAVLMIPAMVAFVVVPEVLVRALFERQEFSAADTTATARALVAYAPTVLLTPLLSAFLSVHFARRRQGFAAAVGLAGVAVNPLLNALLMPSFGHVGIAAATSLVALLQAVVYVLTDADLRWACRQPGPWWAVLRASVASAAMAFAIPLVLAHLGLSAVGEAAVAVAVGGLVFAGVLHLQRGGELGEILDVLRRRPV